MLLKVMSTTPPKLYWRPRNSEPWKIHWWANSDNDIKYNNNTINYTHITVVDFCYRCTANKL